MKRNAFLKVTANYLLWKKKLYQNRTLLYVRR
jgi:hypothetical protein